MLKCQIILSFTSISFFCVLLLCFMIYEILFIHSIQWKTFPPKILNKKTTKHRSIKSTSITLKHTQLFLLMILKVKQELPFFFFVVITFFFNFLYFYFINLPTFSSVLCSSNNNPFPNHHHFLITFASIANNRIIFRH